MREMQCETFQDKRTLFQALGESVVRIVANPRRKWGYVSVQMVTSDGFVVARVDHSCRSEVEAIRYLHEHTRGLFTPIG